MRRILFAALSLGMLFLLTACPQTPPPPVNPAECPVGPQAAPQAWEPLRLQGMGRFKGAYVPGEVLALPAPGLSLQSLRSQVEGVAALEELPFGLVRFKVPEGQEEAKAQALLGAGMRYVQPNYIYRPLVMPNDPDYLASQRPYLNGLVGLEAAWNSSTGRGCPPLIAVLDTGILPHEDFKTSKYLPRRVKLDVANQDEDPTDRLTDSSRGHGLMVAGVLAADTNNRQGIAGITWGGYAIPIKVGLDNGVFSTAYIAQGIRLARSLGVRVVNISLGGVGIYDAYLDAELAQARANGLVILAAAGNYSAPYTGYTSGGPVMFPASSTSVVAVGAVNSSRERADFSAHGPELDLVAPGVNLAVLSPTNPQEYASATGTSFASPVVAGVAALYMSRYASERKAWPTPDQVYLCLTATAEDLGNSGPDEEYGFGLVRADRIFSSAYASVCFP